MGNGTRICVPGLGTGTDSFWKLGQPNPKRRSKILQGGVIRYSPFLSVLSYFEEHFPLYLKNTPFPKKFRNPVPYRHLLSEIFFQVKNRLNSPGILSFGTHVPWTKIVGTGSPVPCSSLA